MVNKLNPIRSLRQYGDWTNVRSEYNQADSFSRGIWHSKLIQGKMWWCVNEWMEMNELEWPVLAQEGTELSE